jgi:hypothetical protein
MDDLITEGLHEAPDREELTERGDQAQQVVDDFISIASAQVQNISGAPGASPLGSGGG